MKEHRTPEAYHEGRAGRQGNKPKSPPYAALSQGWAWWLAGWNDADIETRRKER